MILNKKITLIYLIIKVFTSHPLMSKANKGMKILIMLIAGEELDSLNKIIE